MSVQHQLTWDEAVLCASNASEAPATADAAFALAGSGGLVDLVKYRLFA